MRRSASIDGANAYTAPLVSTKRRSYDAIEEIRRKQWQTQNETVQPRKK